MGTGDQEIRRFGGLTEKIIGAAIEVHRHLGPGLLESVYTGCLCRELRDWGLGFQCEVPVPVVYKGDFLDFGYRVDILVESAVIVEMKAVEHVLAVHKAQVITYLKLAKIPTGLLLNFNVPSMRLGIHRFDWPADPLLSPS